jgi:hypothetical protein
MGTAIAEAVVGFELKAHLFADLPHRPLRVTFTVGDRTFLDRKI